MSATSILTNKHFVVAVIVTPILAILAYVGVDRAVSERPHQAEPGSSYELAASSSCRYSSGHCTFKNGNFKLHFQADMRSEHVLGLTLESEFPLQAAKIAITPDADTEYPPLAMTPISDDGRRWQIRSSVPKGDAPLLRVVAMADDSLYYGETGLAFTVYETSFERDFRDQKP